MLNWSLYIFADVAWNSIFSEMTALAWLNSILLKVICTQLILYGVAIDAYQISRRHKLLAMALVVLAMVYFQGCIIMQVRASNPYEGWRDSNVVLPLLEIRLSLRALMMNSLGNFLLFTGKQAYLMLAYPNKAYIPIYPKIQWLSLSSFN